MQDMHHTSRRSGRIPRRLTSAIALLAIGAALALAGCDTFAGTAVTPTPIAASGAAAAPATTAPYGGAFAGAPGDWPMYGHDPARSGYNDGETALDLSTVGQLGPRWQVGIGIGANPSSSAPSIADGRVFIGSSSTTGDNFFAFDAATGARPVERPPRHEPDLL